MRRHLADKKVKMPDGKTVRVIGFRGARGAIAEARQIRALTGTTRVKSYSSPVARALGTSRLSQRAFGRKGNPAVRIRKELGYDFSILSMDKYAEVVEKKYGNNEAKAVAAWVKGDNLGGSVKPAKEVFETMIRKRFGTAFAMEIGKAGAGTKGVARPGLLVDNLTHSALVEPIVERLTRGLPNHFQIETLVQNNKGIVMNFVPSANGKFRAVLSYEGKPMGDVTKNLAECMLPSLRKRLEA